MKISNKIVSMFGGTDKLLHFLVGMLIVAQFEVFEWYMPIVGVGVVFILALTKELLDDEFDWKDIGVSLIGAMVEIWSLILRMWLWGEQPWGV